MSQRVAYVPGVFDMFHIGHLNILRQARTQGEVLVAGVVTDEVVLAVKGHAPVVPWEERQQIVGSLRDVDEVVEDTSSDKRVAWARRRFDVIVKGDDWRDTEKGRRLETDMAEVGVDVVYLPYTLHTSSTMLRQFLTRSLQGIS